MDNYILITGGAGFIGSFVNNLLLNEGFKTIVIDSLITGDKRAISPFKDKNSLFFEGSTGDKKLLSSIFSTYRIQAVLHFAASLDVGESLIAPLKYYENNVANTLCLIETMLSFNVTRFVFSSTAAVYGNPLFNPLTEEHPKNPINPYGNTKNIVETLLNDLGKAKRLSSIRLRYFNAAGGDSKKKLKNYCTKSHNLIPLLIKSFYGDKKIGIFGNDYDTFDGTCIRDYIHVEDLASAHFFSLKNLLNSETIDSKAYNLGIGKGFSVREVIDTFQQVAQTKLEVQILPRRKGDPDCLIADSTLAKKELLWEPQFLLLEDIIQDAFQGFCP